MAETAFDPDFLIDLFAPFARVSVKRMFSGHAVYREGIVFALALRAGLYLKTDEQTAAAFDAEGLPMFAYMSKGKERQIASYRRMPDACFDDEDALKDWSRLAWQAALRAPVKPKTSRKAGRGPVPADDLP